MAERKNLRTLGLAAALFGLSLLGCGGNPSTETPPHVLLISIDALRADHLGSYGYHRPTSPFLDQLATQGTRYEHAFANTHGTTPSHTTLLTGLHQETHRVGFAAEAGEPLLEAVPEEFVLLPEILKEHGYLTLAVTGGGYVGAKFGFAQGFDLFNDRGGGIRPVVNRTLRILDRVKPQDEPIFLFLHTYRVHSPYEPPPGYLGRFGHQDSRLSPTSESLLEHVHTAWRTLTHDDLEHLKARYDEEIRYTDDMLRSLFEELERRGLLQNCLVIVTSDHGEEFGEHGGLLHRDLLYEELIRVPLIVLGPGLPRERVEPAPVSLVDVAPSVLAYLGLPVPPVMQGRVIFGGPEVSNRSRYVVSQYGGLRYAFRTRDWKLIETLRPPGRELYHLPTDPEERRDLIEEHPEVAQGLLETLDRWRHKHRPLVDPRQTQAPRLDDEELERLRALGYVN